jgi:hypothetical protein
MNVAQRIAEAAAARRGVVVKASSFARGVDGGEIRMRPLFVAEVNAAVEEAFKVRKALLASLPDAHAKRFLDDPSLLDDIKVCEMLWHACRDADDMTRPAFPSAQWMREHLTNDELSALDFFYHKACVADAGGAALDLDKRWFLVRACAELADTDEADAALAKMAPAQIADLFVWLSREYVREMGKRALVES